MLKVNLYSAKGIKKPDITLPKDWEEEKNMYLLSQAMRVYEDNKHPSLSRVKTRSEVARTKKKAYRQKGTGMARHGAKSAPIFVGGGVAHGPKGVKRNLSLPKKIARKALLICLTLKAKEGLLKVVDAMPDIKMTKDANSLISKLLKDVGASRTTVVLSLENKKQGAFFRNIKDTNIVIFESLNAYDVFYSGLLVFDSNIFKSEKKTQSKKTKSKK